MDTSRFTRQAAACRLCLAALLTFGFGGFAASASAADASLHGSVVDQLGAPIPSATVTHTSPRRLHSTQTLWGGVLGVR